MTSTLSLPQVGTIDPPAGQSLLFCNGLMNDLQAAQASAELISQEFNGRKVTIFHNPTTLSDYLSVSCESIDQQISLAFALAQVIHDLITYHTQFGLADHEVSIILFAHSHGAVIAEQAMAGLDTMDASDKSKVQIYAFGGATVIPKNVAYKVHNYFFDEDIVADVGNMHTFNPHKQMVLYHVKHVNKLMADNNISQAWAIVEYAYKSLFNELSPILRVYCHEDHQTKCDKDRRYRQIFELKDANVLVTDRYFTGKIQEYSSIFVKYQIFILSGTQFVHPEYETMHKENFMQDIGAMMRNAVKGIAAFGRHAMSHHYFASYQPEIRRIAHT